jgi:hypothetical protein
LDQIEPQLSVHDPFVALVADHLTAVTRGQKKALLTAAATSAIVFLSGVMPESLPSLGITKRLEPKFILGCLAGIDLYFLLTFIIYWLADYWKWERDLRRSVESLQKTAEGRLSLEEAIDLAIKVTAGDLHRWQWVRWLTPRTRAARGYFKLRAPPLELKKSFGDFAEGKIGVLRLSFAAAPSSWLRLLADGAFPALFGVAAILSLIFRYLKAH